jgi:hypothetical protein
MTTTETTVTVNRATEFANWLLGLIGGTSRFDAMRICIECLLKGHCTEEGKLAHANFISECTDRIEVFRKIRDLKQDFGPFYGFNLLLQEQLYLLGVDTENIPYLRPDHEYEIRLGFLGVPECSADDLIAMVEEAIGERAELENDLRNEVDKTLQQRWQYRTERALQKDLEDFGKVKLSNLDEFEKLISLWRTKLKHEIPGD